MWTGSADGSHRCLVCAMQVSSFVNHMVDVEMMEACGEELAERLEAQQPTKVTSPRRGPSRYPLHECTRVEHEHGRRERGAEAGAWRRHPRRRAPLLERPLMRGGLRSALLPVLLQYEQAGTHCAHLILCRC